MKLKFGVITSEVHLDYLLAIEEEIKDICEIKYLIYHNFAEVADLYKYNENLMDAFVISGSLVSTAIEKNVIDIKKPIYVLDDIEHMFYKTMLKLLIENPNLDFSRTYIDLASFSSPDDDIINLFTKEPKPYFLPILYASAEHAENIILNNHINLWNEGKIDLSITVIGSIVPELNKRGIRNYFIHPSYEYTRDLFNKAINEISLSILRDNKTAIAMVSVVDNGINSNGLVILEKSIINFFDNNEVIYKLIRNEKTIEICISHKDFILITNNISGCSLLNYLESEINSEIKIGWSSNIELYKASLSASFAHKQSLSFEGSCSFYVDDNYKVIGPLNKSFILEVNSQVDSRILDLATNIGINNINLQKIISYAKIVGSNKFSSLEISKCLSITIKGANRILNNIESAGYSESIYEKIDANKGRPTKFFVLNFLDQSGNLVN